jgi:hypothetical protein
MTIDSLLANCTDLKVDVSILFEKSSCHAQHVSRLNAMPTTFV